MLDVRLSVRGDGSAFDDSVQAMFKSELAGLVASACACTVGPVNVELILSFTRLRRSLQSASSFFVEARIHMPATLASEAAASSLTNQTVAELDAIFTSVSLVGFEPPTVSNVVFEAPSPPPPMISTNPAVAPKPSPSPPTIVPAVVPIVDGAASENLNSNGETPSTDGEGHVNVTTVVIIVVIALLIAASCCCALYLYMRRRSNANPAPTANKDLDVYGAFDVVSATGSSSRAVVSDEQEDLDIGKPGAVFENEDSFEFIVVDEDAYASSIGTPVSASQRSTEGLDDVGGLTTPSISFQRPPKVPPPPAIAFPPISPNSPAESDGTRDVSTILSPEAMAPGSRLQALANLGIFFGRLTGAPRSASASPTPTNAVEMVSTTASPPNGSPDIAIETVTYTSQMIRSASELMSGELSIIKRIRKERAMVKDVARKAEPNRAPDLAIVLTEEGTDEASPRSPQQSPIQHSGAGASTSGQWADVYDVEIEEVKASYPAVGPPSEALVEEDRVRRTSPSSDEDDDGVRI